MNAIKWVSGSIMAVLGWYIWRIESHSWRITHLSLPVPHLPPVFEGYRVAHLSDLHLGTASIQRYLPAVIQAVNREHPDLIAITGDFVNSRCADLSRGKNILSGLRAPDGVWASWGNHDYRVGIEVVEALAQQAGITVLRNAHHAITRGTDRLVVAGLDDVIRGIPNLNQTLENAPGGSPVILMVHEPDFARIAAADSRIILQLSGHTHGGQVRLPRIGAPLLPIFGCLYPAGAYRVGNLALYVTCGVGTSRFVIRLNCRPEIVIVSLVRGDRWSGGAEKVWRAGANLPQPFMDRMYALPD
jgi:predicted MPP superfamily phosphohydrolase